MISKKDLQIGDKLEFNGGATATIIFKDIKGIALERADGTRRILSFDSFRVFKTGSLVKVRARW